MRYTIPLLLMFVAGCGGQTQERDELSAEQLAVIHAVHEVDSMRSARAATIGDAVVDFETFASVCPPVGRRAAEIAQANGWQFRQIALKNRNPANYPDSAALPLMERFENNPDLDSLWVETDEGLRYLHRITVEESCLGCHGAAEALPAFVLERYPDDRAYGFEVGDLRGVYSVILPNASSGS